jgi:hypothetical protein
MEISRTHGGDYEALRLLVCDDVSSGISLQAFRRNILLSKMEAEDYSKTLVTIYQSTRHHILEDNN